MFMGYTEATLARKAEARKVSVDDYKAYLIRKRQDRPRRRAEAAEARRKAILAARKEANRA